MLSSPAWLGMAFALWIHSFFDEFLRWAEEEDGRGDGNTPPIIDWDVSMGMRWIGFSQGF